MFILEQQKLLSYALLLTVWLLVPTTAVAEQWQGWYEERGQRIAFRASLNSSRDSFLQGETFEAVRSNAGRNLNLSGDLIGERRGRYWVWTKRYVEVNQEAIQYAAVLSPDGQELSGWWNISDLAQGRFAMRRE